MDSLKNKQGWIINNIIVVEYHQSILELCFNICRSNEIQSLHFCLNDDGESISYTKDKNWKKLEDFEYEIFETTLINNFSISHRLFKIVNQEIKKLKIAIGVNFLNNTQIIYYVVLETKIDPMLYFNNGDTGLVSFDKIEEITTADIFHFEWKTVDL